MGFTKIQVTDKYDSLKYLNCFGISVMLLYNRKGTYIHTSRHTILRQDLIYPDTLFRYMSRFNMSPRYLYQKHRSLQQLGDLYLTYYDISTRTLVTQESVVSHSNLVSVLSTSTPIFSQKSSLNGTQLRYRQPAHFLMGVTQNTINNTMYKMITRMIDNILIISFRRRSEEPNVT